MKSAKTKNKAVIQVKTCANAQKIISPPKIKKRSEKRLSDRQKQKDPLTRVLFQQIAARKLLLVTTSQIVETLVSTGSVGLNESNVVSELGLLSLQSVNISSDSVDLGL